MQLHLLAYFRRWSLDEGLSCRAGRCNEHGRDDGRWILGTDAGAWREAHEQATTWWRWTSSSHSRLDNSFWKRTVNKMFLKKVWRGAQCQCSERKKNLLKKKKALVPCKLAHTCIPYLRMFYFMIALTTHDDLSQSDNECYFQEQEDMGYHPQLQRPVAVVEAGELSEILKLLDLWDRRWYKCWRFF